MSKDIHRAILVVALIFTGCGGEPERSRVAAPLDNGRTVVPDRQAEAPAAKRNIPTH